MEKICNILYLGDSSINLCTEILEEKILSKHLAQEGYKITFNQITEAQCSLRDIISHYDNIRILHPTVIVLYLQPDALSELKQFENDFKPVLAQLKAYSERIVLCTATASNSRITREYNAVIQKLSTEQKIKVANIHYYWKNRNKKEDSDFADKNYGIVMAKAIYPVLVRTKMLVLWQYNGRYAHCNYSCPYCYVATSVNKGIHFQFDIPTWEKAFSKHFEDTETVFYFSYGEPMMGGSIFYDILEMIARHPKWEVRMTSNIAVNLDRVLNTTLAKEGRLHINASFHPTQITVEKFVEQCNIIREHGIEPSIIYVMYPDQIDDFEPKYLPVFNQNGYRVHIRAFRGLYKGKKYPQAYTRDQWIKTARYMDWGNFRYQLQAVNGLGRLSMLGVSHILIDNYGKIEMCDSYVGDRHYGNIFDKDIALDQEPKPFPGLVPLAAVDDIADYVELEYSDLEGNNVNAFNTQGGTIKLEDGEIYYPLQNLDFDDRLQVEALLQVPAPFIAKWRFWLNPRWFTVHFIYSFLIKKYGKYIVAWIGGKYRLLKKGKLSLRNFWHS